MPAANDTKIPRSVPSGASQIEQGIYQLLYDLRDFVINHVVTFVVNGVNIGKAIKRMTFLNYIGDIDEDGHGNITFYGMGGVNLQTTDYTAVRTDDGMLIAFNSGSARILKLPVVSPGKLWKIAAECIGSGGLTVNPNGNKLDGSASTLAVAQNKGLLIYTDGTDYYTMRGL